MLGIHLEINYFNQETIDQLNIALTLPFLESCDPLIVSYRGSYKTASILVIIFIWIIHILNRVQVRKKYIYNVVQFSICLHGSEYSKPLPWIFSFVGQVP